VGGYRGRELSIQRKKVIFLPRGVHKGTHGEGKVGGGATLMILDGNSNFSGRKMHLAGGNSFLPSKGASPKRKSPKGK